MEDNDAQLQLKKRARRRLVGAVAFAGFAAVVLPMIMDQEPQPAPQDVEIRIPGQDEKPFAPKFASVPPTARPAEAPLAPAPVEAAPTEKPVAPAAVKPTEPAARVIDTTTPADKPKPAEKPQEAAKKPADKPAEKATEKPAQEKPAAVTKPAEKPADIKAREAEAARAASILAGKAEPAAAAKPAATAPVPAADGQYVILIGAFADQANVKNLQTKLSEQGIKVYTEPLDSPQGKKMRVRAGPFATKEAADKALEKMKRIGVSGVLAAKP